MISHISKAAEARGEKVRSAPFVKAALITQADWGAFRAASPFIETQLPIFTAGNSILKGP
jgi:hypothetical protein